MDDGLWFAGVQSDVSCFQISQFNIIYATSCFGSLTLVSSKTNGSSRFAIMVCKLGQYSEANWSFRTDSMEGN